MALKEALASWGLDPEKCVAYVADNAANMKKSAELLDFLHIGCFAHTIKLVAKSLFWHTMEHRKKENLLNWDCSTTTILFYEVIF